MEKTGAARHQVVVVLPRMSVERFERWMEDARVVLAEVAREVIEVHARDTLSKRFIRIVFDGNCLTYTWDYTELVAFESILGSEPLVCLNRLTRSVSQSDEWQGDAKLGHILMSRWTSLPRTTEAC